ncbi:hypothetical protein [Nocardia sp. NBC_01009]|uniref:hypothetical protein n=1 Tax=Nocardia sp. NBC_01009 TaxID=2975996 RepID=UPI003865AF27|nr:hypothetical protein OHA42_18380 [Nocardia sp. NBC_01009]
MLDNLGYDGAIGTVVATVKSFVDGELSDVQQAANKTHNANEPPAEAPIGDTGLRPKPGA